MAWDVAGCERMRAAAVATKRARDRLSAQLQRDVPGGLRGRHQAWRVRRRLPLAHRLASQRQLAPQRRSARRLTTTRRSGATPRSSICSTGASTSAIPAVSWPSSPAIRSTSSTGSSAPNPWRSWARGGIYRFNDGREVGDHVYTTFEYPGGRTAVFSSIESNALDHYYEVFFGTKGTLILQGEADAFLFDEAQATRRDRELEMTHACTEGRAGPGGVRKPRRRRRGPAAARRRPPRIGWSPTATRSPASARPSERAAAGVRPRSRDRIGARLHHGVRRRRAEGPTPHRHEPGRARSARETA